VKVTDWPNVAGFRFEAIVVAELAWLMVCVSAGEVLAVKLLSPLYFAVMECELTDKLDSESCAALLETVAVPKDVLPSRNVTVPVALPPKAVWIDADNVTDWPKADGFALEATEVVVAAPFTT
jgi:hypothetical protein